MAVGNIPALLHVAAHLPQSNSNSHVTVNPCHHCGCNHHHDQESEEEGSEHSPHDHDNCRVCQSVFTFFTAPQDTQELFSVGLLPEAVCVRPRLSRLLSDVAVADSRGPPAFSFVCS